MRWSANRAAPRARSFRKSLRAGELDAKEVELEMKDAGGMPSFEIPGMPNAQISMVGLGDIFGKASAASDKTRRMTRG